LLTEVSTPELVERTVNIRNSVRLPAVRAPRKELRAAMFGAESALLRA
jgi:hypothetical protein